MSITETLYTHWEHQQHDTRWSARAIKDLIYADSADLSIRPKNNYSHNYWKKKKKQQQPPPPPPKKKTTKNKKKKKKTKQKYKQVKKKESIC